MQGRGKLGIQFVCVCVRARARVCAYVGRRRKRVGSEEGTQEGHANKDDTSMKEDGHR
jgi:hypothetical protein